MKSIHKRILTIVLIFLLCLSSFHSKQAKASTQKGNNYLVLVQQEDGSWKAYKNLVEISNDDFLMVKAKRISKALGLTYKINKDGTFAIIKDSTSYNTYTKKSKSFSYTNGTANTVRIASKAAYVSKLSKSNLCTASSLNTLLNYRYFTNSTVKEYVSYQGILCFSKYNEIPSTVPIVPITSTEKITSLPAPEPKSIKIEEVEFPVRDSFLSKDQSLSDWGGTAILWDALEQNVNGKILPSTNLYYNSKTIEFSHQGVSTDGVTLRKTKEGYKLSISVKLDGSVLSAMNASMVKAMIVTISSKPTLVYAAIYDSFTSTDSHGINQKKYVTIGDCKIKAQIKEGEIIYWIKQS